MQELVMPSWHNPITWQLQQFFDKNALPVGRHLRAHMLLNENAADVFRGNAFVQTSAFLLNVGTNLNFPPTIYNEVYGTTDLQTLGVYTAQINVRGLSKPAQLLYNLYNNILSPIVSKNIPTFAPGHSYNFIWNACIEAESVLTSSLPGYNSLSAHKQNLQKPNNITYFQNDSPVIYQKIGNQVFYNRKDKATVASTATGINLVPIIVNGILLPPGTLLGIHNPKQPEYLSKAWYQNHRFEIDDIQSLVPLRSTFFALQPKDAYSAFGRNYTEYKQEFNGAATLNDFTANA